MIIAWIVTLALIIGLSLLVCSFPIAGLVILLGLILITFIGWIIEQFEGEKNNQDPNEYYYTLPPIEKEDYDDFVIYSDSYLEYLEDYWNDWD